MLHITNGRTRMLVSFTDFFGGRHSYSLLVLFFDFLAPDFRFDSWQQKNQIDLPAFMTDVFHMGFGLNSDSGWEKILSIHPPIFTT
jgi:hypothetical protein